MIYERETLKYLRMFLDPEGDYPEIEFKSLVNAHSKRKRKKTSRKEKKILVKYLNLFARHRKYEGRYPPHFYDILATKLGWEKERVVKWYNNKRNLSAQNKKIRTKKKRLVFEKKRSKKKP